MNVQIFGIKKCFNTQKAERYFKERGIKYQFIDISKKGLSPGELQSVKASVGLPTLIDSSSKEYEKLNVKQIRSDEIKEEILLKNPRLFKTPIVRNGRQATVGFNEEVWKGWE